MSWRVLASKELLHRPPWLQVIEQRVQLPNGHIIEDYLLTPVPNFSMVVAITEQQDVLLVRQYKHGQAREAYEFPAGYLEEGEDPLLCAQRELLEETGYEAAQWQSLGSFVLDPNRSNSQVHFYLARQLKHVAALHLDAAENITVHLFPAHTVFTRLAQGDLISLACAAAWGLAAPYLTR